MSADDLAAASELCAEDLPQQLLDRAVPAEYVREFLSLLEHHVGTDMAVARAVLCGARALEAFLASDRDSTREIQRLQAIRVRTLVALGDVDAAAELAYQLSAQLCIQGETREAGEVCELVLVALDPDSAWRPYILLSLAEIDRRERRFDQARSRIAAAEALASEDREIAHSVVAQRCQVWLDEGLYDLAAPLWTAQLKTLLELRELGQDVDEHIASMYLIQANARLSAGHYDRAVDDIQRALADLVKVKKGGEYLSRTREFLEIRLALARFEDPRSSAEQIERARSKLEAIFASASADTVTRLASACRLAQWDLRSPGDTTAARSRLARGRALVEDVRRQGAAADSMNEALLTALELRCSILAGDEPALWTPILERLETEFDGWLVRSIAEPPRLGGLAFLRYDRTRSILGELLSAQALHSGPDEGPARALATLHRAGEAGTLHRLLGVETTDLAEVTAKLLPPGAGALVYLPFRDRSLLFAVDRAHGVELHEFAGERALEGPARSWMSDVYASPDGWTDEQRRARSKRLERLGAELSAMLLPPPVRERMRGWDTVWIVGADLVNELPFEALPFEGPRALGLVKALAYLPSLPVGVYLHDRAIARDVSPTSELCLVADIRPEPGPGRPELLPFGQDELAALDGPFPEDRVQRLLGSRASLSELRALDLRRTSLLTFVTHGAEDSTRERPHGLVLSGKESFWCEDAERAPAWAPRLVVLAACEAGRGPQREGDGPVAHLGGAFLRGGADCVVLSDASVAYRPTLAMVAELHARIAQGAAPAEALRLARAEVAKRWNDPFYFGLVRAVGLADRPLR